jgi:SAM-dependent methyltransferase
VPLSHHYYLSYKPLTAALETITTRFAKGRTLDIGCGNKPYEAMFKGLSSEYIGCDIMQSSENKVDIICNASQIPFPDFSFDTVFSTQVIEHFENPDAMIHEAYRLLKPGGHLILSGPMYWHLHEEPHDYFRFTKYGFRLLFEKNNFIVNEILSCGGKWAVLGQVMIHTLPRRLVRLKFFRALNNRIFSYLDNKYYNDFNTLNYVIAGTK